MTKLTQPVIDYCAEEVRRQGHNTAEFGGIQRTAWMLNAWATALNVNWKHPDLLVIRELGRKVEPVKNQGGFRNVPVRVETRICPHPAEVLGLLERLVNLWPMQPLEFYKEFELIHPFVDGNGRVGKIILNGLNGTLLKPIFPPADLFDEPILNP